MQNKKKKLSFILDSRLCKACGICMKTCPAGALHPNENGKPEIEQEKCVNCLMCEKRCPDFAIRFVDLE